jgi:hypothetical protein
VREACKGRECHLYSRVIVDPGLPDTPRIRSRRLPSRANYLPLATGAGHVALWFQME